MLLVRDGRIEAVGTRRQIERLREARRAEKFDLGGRVVLPGFVDSHTHLIFPASRATEYEQRISGATYEQIARKGGGIQSTVKALRQASPRKLKDRALRVPARIRGARHNNARSKKRVRSRLEERAQDFLKF